MVSVGLESGVAVDGNFGTDTVETLLVGHTVPAGAAGSAEHTSLAAVGPVLDKSEAVAAGGRSAHCTEPGRLAILGFCHYLCVLLAAAMPALAVGRVMMALHRGLLSGKDLG